MERVVQLKISIKVPATTNEQTSEFRTSSRWRRRYGLLIAAGAYGLAGHQEPSAGPSSSPGQGETSVCQWGMFQLVPNVSGGSWSWSLCVRSSGRPCQSCEAATAAKPSTAKVSRSSCSGPSLLFLFSRVAHVPRIRRLNRFTSKPHLLFRAHPAANPLHL